MHLGKYKSGYISITDKQSVSNIHKTAAVCIKLHSKRDYRNSTEPKALTFLKMNRPWGTINIYNMHTSNEFGKRVNHPTKIL